MAVWDRVSLFSVRRCVSEMWGGTTAVLRMFVSNQDMISHPDNFIIQDEKGISIPNRRPVRAAKINMGNHTQERSSGSGVPGCADESNHTARW